MQSKNAIGNLINRYKAVLKKCHLLNAFGSLVFTSSCVFSVNPAFAFYEASPTLEGDSAYVVEKLNSDGDIGDYYTTFTVQERQNNTYVEVTYGVLLKKYDYSSSNPTALSHSVAGILNSRRDDSPTPKWSIQQNNSGEGTFTVDSDSFSVYSADGQALTPTSDRISNLSESTNTGTSDAPLLFIGETDVTGGAIYNIANLPSKDIYADFISNAADNGAAGGGGIYNAGTIRNVVGSFIGNRASLSGGGIYNSGTIANITAEFIGNSAPYGAGIINVGKLGNITGIFIGNSSNEGCAITNYNYYGTATIGNITADFIGNRATNGFGGAISNELGASIGSIKGDFIGNSASNTGGAIHNDGEIGTLTGGFINNTANNNGGAIFNEATMTFVGESFFINNTANGAANDIHNQNAIINIGNTDNTATVSFDGGITGNSANKGTINIAADSKLVADFSKIQNAGAMITSQTINLAGDSQQIGVQGLEVDKEYTLSTNTTFSDSDANNIGDMLEEDGYLFSVSNLFDIIDFKYDEATETVTFNTKASNISLPGLDSGLGDLIIADGSTNNSFIMAVRDNNTISDAKKATTIEEGTKLSITTGVMPSIDTAKSVTLSNIDVRTGMTTAENTSPTATYVASAGSDIIIPSFGAKKVNPFGVWFMPMFKYSEADGFESGNFEYGYNSTLYGANLGADYTFANGLRTGIATSFGSGTTDSTGDFSETKNDFDYYGATLYVAKNFGNFGLSFDLGYTMSDNEMSQDNGVDGDTRAHLFATGIKGLYRFNFENAIVIPFAGIRYGHYHTESYDSHYNGSHSLSTSSLTNEIWEFPVGVEVEKTFDIGNNGWKMTPKLGLGVKFSAGDLEGEHDVQVAGVVGQTSLKSDVADSVTFQGSLAINFVDGETTTLGLEYSYNGSEHLQSHGVNAVFRYNF